MDTERARMRQSETRRQSNLLAVVLACVVLAGSVYAGDGLDEPDVPDAPDCSIKSLGLLSPPIQIEKSPNDHREYRYLELNNGLRVLLASDPETNKAAASLVVFRGSFHDPDEHSGLAHFLEHMLLIGTHKYPEVNGFDAFVSANGGTSNAYTGNDHTNYYFNIDPTQFRAGLDRFAQFFVAPLLDPAYVEREINAVAAEHKMRLKDDGWRVASAYKMALNPAHPAARFDIGNLDTLGPGTEAALKAFLREHYSADQMGLVALSDEPLDEMQCWVAPLFEAIVNRRIGTARVTTALYRPDNLPATLNVLPEQEVRGVTFHFPIPSILPHFRVKPVAYIGELLEHEGEGSLHAVLTDKGWIEGLIAGSGAIDDAHSALMVGIELTESGIDHVDTITGALFVYIDLLRSDQSAEWRYAEQSRIEKIDFLFKEPSSALSFVKNSGPRLAWLPPEDLLRAPYLMSKFDPGLIANYLSHLNPENVLITIVQPQAVTDRFEPWFEVHYSLEPGPIAVNNEDFEFSLPSPNRFIPDDLRLFADDGIPPKQIDMAPELQVWFDKDIESEVPRSNLHFLLTVKGGFASAFDYVAADLYRELVLDALNESAYSSWLAGLSHDIDVDAAGYEVVIRGYSDKQRMLLRAAIEALVNLEIDPERFRLIRDATALYWRNFALESPADQADAALGDLLLSSWWPADLLAEVAEGVTEESLNAWRKEKLSQFGVVALLHGNLEERHARALVETVRDTLPLGTIAPYRDEVVAITESYRIPLDVDHDDAMVLFYVQDAKPGVAAQAKSMLAAQLLEQPFLTTLRTEQQLGYLVYATDDRHRDHSGVSFVVQSPVASPAAIEQAILSFLDDQSRTLVDMSEEFFERHKCSLADDLNGVYSNSSDRADQIWRDLDLGYTNFDYDSQLADAVAALEKAEMQRFMEWLRRQARENRVIIYSLGKFDDAPEAGMLIEDLASIKSQLMGVSTVR